MPQRQRRQNNLVLIEKKRKSKIRKVMIFFVLILLLAAGIYYLKEGFTIHKIEVDGMTMYTEKEVIDYIRLDKDYMDNSLAMIVFQKITNEKYLPFIENMSMSISKPHVLKVHIKESIRAGAFKYSDSYFYFNSEGIALESRDSLLPGVPLVTGISTSQIILNQKIPVEGDYFDTILSITKKIATYQLDISRIHFEKEDDIYLVSDKYQIYLGSSQYLGSKMAKISELLKAVSTKFEEGTIDMHLYTDEKDIIVFRK
ncbi:MAG: hypothetical protein Q4E53_08080 [Eubacteriales bacterium]|nr:hypothetical protein [Eubacteriales bacterium]